MTDMIDKAYDMGRENGAGIAAQFFPTIGETYFKAIKCTPANMRDVHQHLAAFAESEMRSMPLFALVANELDEADDSDAAWRAFDAGVLDAIMADIEAFTDADYGIAA